jgi:drug/metabolite transporter (DMT)-like permease
MQANLYALGAIALWASLASLGVSLTHIPPFLLTGIALIIGSVPAWPFVLRDPSQWRIPARTLALGVYGLFAYHFLLFIALRHAPPVEANLVNYLWPLFIVVLAPVVLPGVALRLPHVLAALLGFGGAAIAMVGGRELSGTLAWGYLPALAAAFIWATYSLLTKRVAAFPTTAIGLFDWSRRARCCAMWCWNRPLRCRRAIGRCWPCWAWARWAHRSFFGIRRSSSGMRGTSAS